MDFYQTVRGAKFYDGTMPKIARELERIANAMEEANRLKEIELKAKEEHPNNVSE